MAAACRRSRYPRRCGPDSACMWGSTLHRPRAVLQAPAGMTKLSFLRAADDADDVLRAREAERLVEPESVVVHVGDDHEPVGTEGAGGVIGSIDEQTRRDPLPAVPGRRLAHREAPAAARDDDPAARCELTGRGIEGDIPRAATRPEVGLPIAEAGARGPAGGGPPPAPARPP